MNSLENNNRAASQDFQTALGLLEERLRSLEDSEDIIDGLLQGAAEFYGAARASVVEADWDLKIGLLTYEWCAEGEEHAPVHKRRTDRICAAIMGENIKRPCVSRAALVRVLVRLFCGKTAAKIRLKYGSG